MLCDWSICRFVCDDYPVRSQSHLITRMGGHQYLSHPSVTAISLSRLAALKRYCPDLRLGYLFLPLRLLEICSGDGGKLNSLLIAWLKLEDPSTTSVTHFSFHYHQLFTLSDAPSTHEIRVFNFNFS